MASPHPRRRRAIALFAVLTAGPAACGRSNLESDDSFGAGGGGGAPASSSGSLSHSSSSSHSGPTSSSQSSSSSGGGTCFTPADCDDADKCTTDACVNGKCAHKPRDD